MTRDGILDEKLLDILWRDYEGQDKALRPYLLGMMVKFGLMVQLRDGTFLVPSLLGDPTSGPSSSSTRHSFYVCFVTDHKALDQASVTASYMRSRGFLPHGLYARLLGKCVTWSESTQTHEMSPTFSKTRSTLAIGQDVFEIEELLDINAIKVTHPLMNHTHHVTISEVPQWLISDLSRVLYFR